MSLALRIQDAWLRRGFIACLLWPLSCVYRCAVALRHALRPRAIVLPVPVIVVGNLIAGGAGKTPTTLALVSLLRARGHTPGIVSRGHGRQGDGVQQVLRDTPVRAAGDEPLLMHLRSGAPVVVGTDRVAAGLALLQAHPGVDVLLSDDGLQHTRLARNAQVIVFDERGTGNGWLLPAGPLREPIPAKLPARSVVVYNAEAPSMAWPGHLAQRRLAGIVSLTDWWAGASAATGLPGALQGRPVLAAAGVARPQRFFDMLRAAGLAITELPLPDHHDFAALPWPADTIDVVVTEKDAVKLQPEAMGRTRVWVATLDFQLGAAFATELLALLPD